MHVQIPQFYVNSYVFRITNGQYFPSQCSFITIHCDLFKMEKFRWCGTQAGKIHGSMHGCMVVSHGHTNYFHWKTFVVANQSMKTTKSFHLKQFASYSKTANLLYHKF